MARLRKKDRWLDRAQAMIEGESLVKTTEFCGVHPSTAFRWRHRFLCSPAVDKPRTLSGIVEADETFVLEIVQGAADPTFRARPVSEAVWPGVRASYQENIPILVARDRRGATFDAVLPQVASASIGAALAGVITPSNHLVCDGGRAIAALARKANPPSRRPRARQAGPPKRPTSTSTTSTPTIAA